MEITIEMVEMLNQLMQRRADNTNVRYFIQDGEWYYQDDDGDTYESKEEAIEAEIQELWEEFLEDEVRKVERDALRGGCYVRNYEEAAYLGLINSWTDYEESDMERFLLDHMNAMQAAAAYKEYLEAQIPDALGRLQVMVG